MQSAENEIQATLFCTVSREQTEASCLDIGCSSGDSQQYCSVLTKAKEPEHTLLAMDIRMQWAANRVSNLRYLYRQEFLKSIKYGAPTMAVDLNLMQKYWIHTVEECIRILCEPPRKMRHHERGSQHGKLKPQTGKSS